MKLRINARDIVTSALVAVVPHMTTCQTELHAGTAIESNKPHLPQTSGGTELNLDLVVPVERTANWSAEKNARFKELAVAEASRDLTLSELSELEALTDLRRFEKYPRSANEILWQRQQDRVTNGVVRAIEAYVKFHEAPGRT